MKELEHALLSFIESLPQTSKFSKRIFKSNAQKKQEVRVSIAALMDEAGGREYLEYLLQLIQRKTIDVSHIKHFFALRNQGAVPEHLQEHYALLAETVLTTLLSGYSIRRIDHSALYMITDFFMVRKADFILLAPAVFQLIIDPKDLTPPLIEKLCETLIEHYHIEDILVFLVVDTPHAQKEILKITHALSFGQKLYRKKREKRHRLLDKDKVSRMWFQTPFKTFRRNIINKYRDTPERSMVNDREIEARIEKETLERIQKKFKPSSLKKDIDEQKPTAFEKSGLELVLLRNNEDIFTHLIETISSRKKLEALCKYMWMFMHLLRVRSLHDDSDKEKIHLLTVQYAFEEIKGTTPIIFYIEDNGRYQDIFTRHINFECQSLELATPKIIVYPSVAEFRQQVPKIVEETRNALAHIFVIDGILADGTWRDVLGAVEAVELQLWEQKKETLYSVKYLFTGDIAIARDAYHAKILDRVPLDGVFVKPLESWDDTFLEISLRARKTGIQTDDVLYHRIVTIVREVMA